MTIEILETKMVKETTECRTQRTKIDRPCKVAKSIKINEIWLKNEGLCVAVKIQNISAAMKEDTKIQAE